jgi:hypothetical protein
LLLKEHSDQELMAWILNYKIHNFGPAEFTPVTNPVLNPDFDKYNLTIRDLQALLHLDLRQLQNAADIVSDALSTHGEVTCPPYL